MVATKDSKDQISKAFQQILTERKRIDSRIATKEEEAEKEKNKQILEVASTYTVDSIIKGLADLQLEFGTIVNGLSEKLTKEAGKLDELNRAISVETQHLQELQQVRIVADALHLLTQEHQENLKTLEQNSANQRETIEKDMAEKRKLWEKEQQDFENNVRERNELLVKERQLKEADYQYELERKRKVETDEYEELKRSQERELLEANREKDKQWTERERILTERQPLLEEYQQKVDKFPTELDEAVKKAREEAIKEIHQDAKVKAELVKKEWESTKQGYEFKIQSLEQTIQKQIEQIEHLSTQLQETMKQAQSLAMKAFESSSASKDSSKS
jgi:DNA repair exonuclease SbcCD ATPase subunit